MCVFNKDSGEKICCFSFLKDDELRDMIKSAERIDYLYGHFMDDEIVNDDLAAAFEQLVICAEKAENEPLWAPTSWVQ